MTSKASPAAAKDPKTVLPCGLATQEDLKASATSGNDEPTNSSSAGSLNPSTKKEKSQKALKASPSLEPDDSESLPVASSIALTLTNERPKDCAKEPEEVPAKKSAPPSLPDLRKLARKPGSR